VLLVRFTLDGGDTQQGRQSWKKGCDLCCVFSMYIYKNGVENENNEAVYERKATTKEVLPFNTNYLRVEIVSMTSKDFFSFRSIVFPLCVVAGRFLKI
jgi:hypothetical protein